MRNATAVMAAVGWVVWLAALVLLPAPLAARILLLAPLVIVPRLIGLLPARRRVGILGGWTPRLAAMLLVLAFGVPAGPVAGALAGAWMGVALIGAAAGVRHAVTSLPAILRPANRADLGIDIALGFWAIGAAFAVIDRLGVDTGFSATIVLLTAVHFHFAGFGLLGVAALRTAARPGLGVPVLALAVGIPITALGFVVSSDLIGAAGAVVVGSAGIAIGIALVTEPGTTLRAWLTRAAGVALLVGMPMGIAWSVAMLAGTSFLDLDTMVRTHGVLNSTAVLLAALALEPGPCGS